MLPEPKKAPSGLVKAAPYTTHARFSDPDTILALPNAPTISRLAQLGVARVSYGSLIQHRLLGHLATMLAEIRG